MNASTRWFRLLLRFYPPDFQDEVGDAVVATYRDRARTAHRRGGAPALARVWIRALLDSARNGLAERARPGIGWRRTGNWGRDTQLALRRLARAPLFAAATVATMTVGLGAFAVVYTAVDRVLLAPLPYDEPDDLYHAWRDYTWFGLHRGWLAGTDIAALDTVGGPILQAVGMQRTLATFAARPGDDAEEIPALIASPGFFDLLGVAPALGRGFLPEEVGPGRDPVVVLGHDLWQRRFNADPGVLGAEIRLNGNPYTVVGVADRRLDFMMHRSLGPPAPVDLFLTFDVHLAETNPGAGSYAGLFRAAPGASSEVVAEAVAAVGAQVDELFGNPGLRIYSVAMKADLVAGIRPALLALAAAGAFLLLALLVNLSALLLARAAQREREFAIIRALGANRLAIARATLLEGGLLGLLGGAGGALAGLWGARMLVHLAPPDLPRLASVAVDPRIALVVIATGAAAGLLAGAVPALWAARTRLGELVGRAATRGGGGSGRLRRAMVVVQVALSLVLLSAGGLVVRSFDQLLRSEPGFDPAGVLTLRVPVPAQMYPAGDALAGLQERIHTELASLPGVGAVGAASGLPLSGNANQMPARFPGAPGNTGDDERDAPLVDYLRVRPGHFEALGVPVLAGRTFDASPPAGVREAVIDRTLAQRFFTGEVPALGATLVMGEDTLTVIGVVEHARLYDLHRDDREQVYLRNTSPMVAGLYWTVRADRRPESMVGDVRAAIRRIDPALAVSEIRTMDRIVAESVGEQRLSAVLIAGFALGALLLAAVGLFGVVAGTVARRRQELAVRLALGADHRRVLGLVVGDGARLVALGLALGVPGTYLAGRAVRGLLVGVSPTDPATLAAVALGLAVVALAACYLPARRVLRIAPSQVLREE